MNIGGAPSVVLSHLRTLDRSQFEPWLLTLYASKPANFLKEAEESIGKDHIISFSLKNRSLLDIGTWWQIYKALRREQFAIVITHLFLTNCIVRAVAVAARIPRILSYEHSRYDGKKWWQKIVDRLLAQATHRIAVAHEEIAEFTSKQEGIPLKKFLVIPNPVTLPKANPAEELDVRMRWGVPKTRTLFVSVGRFSEEKGHEYLIRAAAILKSQAQDFCVLIVGHGALRKELKDLVTSLGVEDVCRVVEDPVHARYAYRMGDIFVLSSLREGESIAMREALLAGLPVIVSDLPTLRTLVQDTGISVPCKDAAALADAMLRLSNDKQQQAEFSKEATARSATFSQESALHALQSILV